MDQSHDPTTAFWTLGSEQSTLGSGVWSYRATAARIGLANFVHSLRPAGLAELDADLSRLTTEREHPCRRVVMDHDTPDWVEADLVMRGWQIETELRLGLPERTEPTLSSRQRERLLATASHVGPADELDPQWSARRAMFRIDHLQEDSRDRRTPRPQSHTDAAVDLRLGIEHHASYHCAVFRAQVTGFLCTWRSPDDVGVIEDVFVHPDHRRAGVATQLLLHGLKTLRDDGAGLVVIAADPADTPRHLYQRLGFTPRGVVRSLTR